MKKLLWLCALLVPTTAFAAGVDLSWNDCVGGGPEASNKNFLCTGTLNQTYTLALYFKPPVDMPQFVGIRIDIDLQSETPGNLAPFWHYESGGCNRPAVGVSGVAMFDNVGSAPAGCQGYPDPWGGDGTQGFEGIAAYAPDFSGPGNGHFVLGVAHSGNFPLATGVNYYAGHMTFNNRNRPGSGGNCAGCSDKVVLVWNNATLEGIGQLPVNLGLTDKFANCAMINGGSQSTCDATPTRNTSWGQIKSLYR